MPETRPSRYLILENKLWISIAIFKTNSLQENIILHRLAFSPFRRMHIWRWKEALDNAWTDVYGPLVRVV